MTESTVVPTQMHPHAGDAANGQTAALPAHDVTDLGLADEGVRRIEWQTFAGKLRAHEHDVEWRIETPRGAAVAAEDTHHLALLVGDDDAMAERQALGRQRLF